MELGYNLVVFLHLLGMASLVGGWLAQVTARGEHWVSNAIRHGAGIQLVTGVALVGMAEAIESLEKDVAMPKIAVKLGVALAVLVLAQANRRRQTIPDGVYVLIGALAVANVAVAVLWT